MTEKKGTKSTKTQYFYSCGKRKTSIARVRLYPKGELGEIIVNEKPIQEYCSTNIQVQKVKAPLKLTGNNKNFEIKILVKGGGADSQAEAMRHGISRALELYDKELRPTLKKAGFLTRDPRSKERKKFGLKRARRAPQFSKR